MIDLISIELYKIFKKWRTYIGFIAIGVLVPLIHYSFFLAGDKGAAFALRNFGDTFVYSGNLLNGYFISTIILNSLFVHVPFLIVLVGGDMLAGEATGGTYRMLLTRPVSRFQIITAKFLASIIYTVLIILWLALMSLGLGLLFFGGGPLIMAKSKIIIFAPDDILWRFFCAYAFASLSMSVVITLAFLFSSFVANAIGPIVTTMAIIIVFFVISAIDLDIFTTIKPYLFTNYLTGWNYFFDDPIDVAALWKDIWVLIIHISGFYLLSLIIFYRKDILT